MPKSVLKSVDLDKTSRGKWAADGAVTQRKVRFRRRSLSQGDLSKAAPRPLSLIDTETDVEPEPEPDLNSEHEHLECPTPRPPDERKHSLNTLLQDRTADFRTDRV